MSWTNQDPPETALIAVFCNNKLGFSVHIDEPFKDIYRATMGDLFNCKDLCRTPDLKSLLRLCSDLQLTRNDAAALKIRNKIMEMK